MIHMTKGINVEEVEVLYSIHASSMTYHQI
jgi:hypothetical protein